MKQKTETKYSFNEYLATFFPHGGVSSVQQKPSDADELIKQSREKVRDALRMQPVRPTPKNAKSEA